VAASGSPVARGGGGTALERYWDVKNPFWGSGEEWLTGVALTMVVRLAEGGSPVRGHWRGQGRSLCGRRGAPGRTRLEAGRRHEGTLAAKKPACVTRRRSRMPRDSTTTRRVVRGSSSMVGRLGEDETSGLRWTPSAGAIGDGGRHRTRTRRHGGGGTTHSDQHRGGLDGASWSGVEAQGPTAWGGLELRFMRAHGRRCEVGQHRKRRVRGGATAASVADGSR
jgi:hypothetical protein